MADTIEFVIKLRGGPEAAAQARAIRDAVKGVGGTVSKVGAESEKAARGTNLLGGSLKKMAVGLAGIGIGWMAYRQAKGAIDYTADLAAKTDTFTKVTKMSTQESSKWIGIANATGVEGSALGQMFAKVSKEIGMQAKEHAAGSTALEKIGISAREAEEHMGTMGGALDLIHAKLEKVQDPFVKTNAQLELFGRGWQQLAPVLDGNAQKYEEMAAKFGVVLNPKTTSELNKIKDAQIEWKFATQGLQIAFTQLAAGPLIKVMHGMSTLANMIRKEEWKRAGALITKGIEGAAKLTGTIVEKVMPKVAEGFAHAAPKVFAAFARGFVQSSLPGQLLIGAVLFTKMGLTADLAKGLGASLGGEFGAAFVVGAIAAAAAAAYLAQHGLASGLTQLLGAGADASAAEAKIPLIGKVRRENEYLEAHPKAKRHAEAMRPLPSWATWKRSMGAAGEHMLPAEERRAKAEWQRERAQIRAGRPKAGMGAHTLAPGLLEVGDRGPEILSLPENASVAPLDAGSWAQGDIVVNVDGKQLARVSRRQAMLAQAAGAG